MKRNPEESISEFSKRIRASEKEGAPNYEAMALSIQQSLYGDGYEVALSDVKESIEKVMGRRFGIANSENVEFQKQRMRTVARLLAVLEKYPDLRVGQLIYVVIGDRDLFNLEDGVLEGLLGDA